MPRYHFVVRFSDYIDEDNEGTWLPNASAARDYALRIIGELKQGEGYGGPDLMMIVKDAWDEELFVIPFAQPGGSTG